MNTKLSFLIKGVLGLALMSMPLNANETELQERIPVGTRLLEDAEKARIQEDKYALIEKLENDEELTEEENALVFEDEEELKSKLIKKKVASKAGSYYTSHEGALHRPTAVSPLGENVELEDGSIWMVASGDRHKTLDWMTGDTIIILPNHSWFSSYDFRFLNLNTGANVKVNLSLGPIYNGIYTHWIIGIDYKTREICLEDGSVWKISGWDGSNIQYWLANDTVIIGCHDGWFSGSNPNMLININMSNTAIGKCVY